MNPNRVMSVLIVDDTPLNIQVLAEALKADYRVRVATRGEKALEIAASPEPPDLILLDVMMPGMDGYEVCRRLKGNTATNAIPVIFVTARGEVEEEERGLSLGAVDYITKPFYLPTVKVRIRNHLSLKLKTDLLEELASLDGLTNIPNRRCFDDALIHEWRRAARTRTPLSLLMVDVDHFKAFNDHQGHGAGDECLKRVAHALAGSLYRPGDMVARYGGEEFALLLPDTGEEAVRELAERTRQAVAALALRHAASSVAPVVTVSVGFATCRPEPGEEDALVLLNAADRGLYQAKAEGRNRVRGGEAPGQGDGS